MIKNIKYTAAFTAGALLYNEFLSVRSLMEKEDVKELLDTEVMDNNVLAIKTESARKRIVLEMNRRIASAPEQFWDFFYEQTEAEQRLALLFLCLRTYPLMLDFHIEVTLVKWKTLNRELENFDIQMRFDEIASSNEIVENWSTQTKNKLITTYLNILRQAKLMDENDLVKPRGISTSFLDYFRDIGEEWFIEAAFLR